MKILRGFEISRQMSQSHQSTNLSEAVARTEHIVKKKTSYQRRCGIDIRRHTDVLWLQHR